MALHHGHLPRTLHVDEPTPHVDWHAGAVALLTEPRPWQANGHPRRAAVSSFGIGGTNAHLLLEEPPPAEPAGPTAAPEPAERTPVDGARPAPWLLSARTEPALRAQAGALLETVAVGDGPGVAQALLRRARFEHRAVALGTDALGALADGRSHP